MKPSILFISIACLTSLTLGSCQKDAGTSDTPANATGKLVIPPSPGSLAEVEHLKQSDDYVVEVRRTGEQEYQPLFVYQTDNYWVDTHFGGQSRPETSLSFSEFSFEGTKVDVRITAKVAVSSFKIKPSIDAIQATQSGNVISFTLESPKKLSIEINDVKNPLFLFADAPEPPVANATYYYGPGVHNIGKRKVLKSNESVYLAGGAVVEGSFYINHNSTNVKIQGRGILSMGEWPTVPDLSYATLRLNNVISSYQTNNLLLEGIMIVNSTGWTIAIEGSGGGSHHNQIRDIKIMNWNGCTDGIWYDGDNHTIKDCFIFNNDDAVVTHGSNNCDISDMVIWTGHWGRVFEHYQGASCSNLTFSNIDVIDRESGYPIILIENKNKQDYNYNNFLFKDIRVENNPYETPSRPGRVIEFEKDGNFQVNNWVLENWTLKDRKADEGLLYGSPDGKINGITFKNFKMGGMVITDLPSSNMKVNEHTTNISFIP